MIDGEMRAAKSGPAVFTARAASAQARRRQVRGNMTVINCGRAEAVKRWAGGGAPIGERWFRRSGGVGGADSSAPAFAGA
jgi:hypothetical protein